ncbi:hypothetical protein L249_5089 [Ophiocordyceps polyrhachis-furcata BCC 54312]|uniref:Uncharacterized protein n=1 Tax=Ophiocordyceps polyrhachis-furcata BCC 54312 TaxID=1330021 RepID=A0A367L3G5_9HYPO|nr:hypothetical protein L249_5089 [Ophiocordyceps polyrhachis-furcata BCC 54312]
MSGFSHLSSTVPAHHVFGGSDHPTPGSIARLPGVGEWSGVEWGVEKWDICLLISASLRNKGSLLSLSLLLHPLVDDGLVFGD